MPKNRTLMLACAAMLVATMSFLRVPSNVSLAQGIRQPFRSSIEQRQQTIEELRKLNRLMQKQLDLLASGKVKVIVVERSKQNEK